MTPRRVALWLAVSTPAQASDDKDSLPLQEHHGRAFAEAIGGEVVRIYTVPGHSRRYIDYPDAAREMEAYRQLDADCAAQAFDVLWCRSRDRLGRTLSLIAAVEGRVREIAGAEVYSAAMPHQVGTATTDSAVLMTAIEGWNAQREVAEIARRHTFGMRARVRRGMTPGTPPYGYRSVRDSVSGRTISLEPDEHAQGLRCATRLFLEGQTYGQIRQALEASGHVSPTGKPWDASYIRWMMKNDVYAGLPSFGEAKALEPSEHYPPLWDPETYRAILRERERRRCAHNRRADGYCTSGVVVCARCGRGMSHYERSKGGHTWVYLRCTTHADHSKTGAYCHSNNIPQHKPLAAIAAWIREMMDPARLEAELAERRRPDGPCPAATERAISATMEKRKRLALAYAAGAMELSVYADADRELGLELARMEDEHASALTAAAAQVDPAERRAALLELGSADLLALPPLKANTLLRELGVKVEVEGGEVVFCGWSS